MSITTAVSAFDIRLTDTPTPDADREAALAAPKFGTVFSDHMARVSWTSAEGWHDRVPLHQLHPLLVHAALFGGGYGARATAAAEQLLAARAARSGQS